MTEDTKGQVVAGAILAGVLWFVSRRRGITRAPATEPAPRAAMAIPGEAQTLAAHIDAGQRDPAALTDLIFFGRHPERQYQPISKTEPALAREWVAIRDTLVKAALAPAFSSGGASGTF